MALKRLANGQYVIKSAKEAAAAMGLFQTLAEEVAALRQEHGITEIEEDQIELKKAVTQFMIDKSISDIKIPERDGMYGKLIEQGYDKRVIATQEELDEYQSGDAVLVSPDVIPLRKLFLKKFGKGTDEFKAAWKRATKAVADVPELEMMVGEEILSVKELAQCYAEKKKKPYLRIFGKE